MTLAEARWILFLRCGLKATYSYIDGLVTAIYGDNVDTLCPRTGHTLGLDLVAEAERVGGLEVGESDHMVNEEIICTNCHKPQWSLHWETDIANECQFCHAMACFPLKARGHHNG